MLTYVLSADGSPLMPTYNIRKVRHMLKDGRAVIAGHKPGFTIRLTYSLPEQDTPHTQETELCEDMGDHHIDVSVNIGVTYLHEGIVESFTGNSGVCLKSTWNKS